MLDKVLVIKLAALGDFIQAIGPFTAIRKHHSESQITLLTTKPFVELAHASRLFDQIWVDKKPHALAIGNWYAPSRSVVPDSDRLNTCKSVFNVRYSDCVTKITVGYHSSNLTNTYIEFTTSAGRRGSLGRKHSSQKISSYFTTKKTCLRGIFFNGRIQSNVVYVGALGFYFDTQLGRSSSVMNSTPMSPAVAGAIVGVIILCICCCVCLWCYQKGQ